MRFSKVLIIFNPIAGRGDGQKLAERSCAVLKRNGHNVRIAESKAGYLDEEVALLFTNSELVIVAGGDGTLQALLPHLARSRIPVLMLPAGNESLFAKEFKMAREATALQNLIAHGQLSPRYFGHAGTKPFFHMASIGFDAEVVFRISQSRRGPIGHKGYIVPTLISLFRHRVPEITVTVDGATIVDREQGFLIVANTPAYAAKMLFVPEADSQNPTLCGRFFPLHSVLEFARLALYARGSRAPAWPSCKLLRGREFSVATDSPNTTHVQADGDYAGATPMIFSKGKEQIIVLQAPQ